MAQKEITSSADRQGAGNDACSVPLSAHPVGAGASNAFAEHIFEYREVETRKLGVALALNLAGMVVEIVGGILSGSISLLSDAGHMFTDSFALFISLGAIIIARNPPCHHRTFGWFRAEILAAFVNSLFLFGVSLYFILESARRFVHPVEVRGPGMLLVGLIGLAVNLLSMFILRTHHRDDLNTRSAFVHMLTDTLSSGAVVAGAVFISLGGSSRVDPLLGIAISAAILVWAWGLFQESIRILLEMAPPGVDIDSVARDVRERFPEIKGLYNVHFWAITGQMYVFTAHARFRERTAGADAGRELVARVNRYLKERYPIVESTIQWID